MKCRLSLSLLIVLFGQTFPPKKFTYNREDKGSAMGTPFYPKSAIKACLDFDFLEEWILFGF